MLITRIPFTPFPDGNRFAHHPGIINNEHDFSLICRPKLQGPVRQNWVQTTVHVHIIIVLCIPYFTNGCDLCLIKMA